MALNNFATVQYINLITYKRNNTPVATAVWVVGVEDVLYVTTGKVSGKVKRIRNNGKATIHETNQSGSQKLSEDLDLHATIVEDPVEKRDGVKAITKKYGLMAKMLMRGPDEDRAIIKLVKPQ
jgi:PPOX class probable F420-dependent enzyme|tara:strand:- start:259 stop:627 length:369 start_codon:yes stop_codon:yes gene_type:complete